MAVHISANYIRSGGTPTIAKKHKPKPTQAQFAIVETYAAASVTPTSGWKPYTNEILKVPLDGSPVTRLCHHRSRGLSYTTQPKATVSGNGRYVLFSSNMANPTIDTCDVYMMDLAPGNFPRS